MGQYDAHLTSDQEVAASILLGQATFFHEYFLLSFSLSSADSRRAVVSFWLKNVHKDWLTT